MCLCWEVAADHSWNLQHFRPELKVGASQDRWLFQKLSADDAFVTFPRICSLQNPPTPFLISVPCRRYPPHPGIVILNKGLWDKLGACANCAVGSYVQSNQGNIFLSVDALLLLLRACQQIQHTGVSIPWGRDTKCLTWQPLVSWKNLFWLFIPLVRPWWSWWVCPRQGGGLHLRNSTSTSPHPTFPRSVDRT